MPRDNSRPFRDIGHRVADLRRDLARRRSERVSQDTLARLVGVASGTVTAWEIGKQKPDGENLLRLAAALETTPDFIIHGREKADLLIAHPDGAKVLVEAKRAVGQTHTVRERVPSYLEEEALNLFGGLDEVVRHLRGVAPPGEAKARKLTAVDAVERYAVAIGRHLPDWFFDLRRQINEGEL